MKLVENWQDYDFKFILDLYKSVNWTNYTKEPDSLRKALENSTSVVLAIDEEIVVGLARSISDDISIHYLQDILVNPSHQRKGVGRMLLDWSKKRYENVKIHMLLTDDEEKQHRFYKSFDYKNTKDLKKHNLNAFVRMNGIDLK